MLTTFVSPAKKSFWLSFLLLFFVSGCGQPPLAQQPPQQPAPTPVCRNDTSTPAPGPVPIGSSVTFDLGGCVHIQSASGFTCDAQAQTPPGLLVLSMVQPTYDRGTLQSVQQYVSDLYKNPGDGMTGNIPHHRDTVPYPPFSAARQTFQLLPVSRGEDCDEFLQLSNISSAMLRITVDSVILTADSQQDTRHYQLIDECSLLSLASGCTGGLGGGGSIYTVKFLLQPGKKNQRILAAPTDDLNTNTFTLLAGEVAEVILEYSSSAHINSTFALMPSFLIGQPGAPPISYSVPQLQETFTFALRSQFSCYGLQGQRFVAIPESSNTRCI